MPILWRRITRCHRLRTCINSRPLSTVYALSSGQGKCGVALVRVTGDKSREVLTNMTVPGVIPKPRVTTLRRIIHPVTGEGLDRGLVLWFPGPHSFTGEDSCEVHIHGGSAVISAVLEGLSNIPGFHPAQPGDFTKRAFYNGKLDLTSVEGLGDLIHAETEAQRKQALQQMEGALGQLYTSWRQILIHCRANIEAFIDFSEDENIEEGVLAEVETKIRKVVREMENHLSDNRRGERLRSGLHLAILGRPNVGKSSFLNALVQRPAAIVSPIPGTTRDIVETTIDLGGYPVVLSDTAGLRQTEDLVETEGIKRALAKSKEADVAVIILEASEILPMLKQSKIDWSKYLKSYFAELGMYYDHELNMSDYDSYSWIKNNKYLALINKIDLIDIDDDKKLLEKALHDSGFLMSVKTREGFDDALNELKEICASLCEIGTKENPTLTAARHRIHISSCLESLKMVLQSESENHNCSNIHSLKVPTLSMESPRSGDQLGGECLDDKQKESHYKLNQDVTSKSSSVGCSSRLSFEDFDDNLLRSEETLLMAAHHLQRATNHLGYVTGHVTTEDILDHIFSAFCIGK